MTRLQLPDKIRHTRFRSWRLPVLFLSILLLVCLSAALYAASFGPSPVSPQNNLDLTLPRWPLHILRGTAEERHGHTLLVQDTFGRSQTFDLSQATITDGAGELSPGSPVTIAYLGDSSGSQPSQVLFVTSDAPPTPKEIAQDWLDSMTLEEKVGQMFLARCPKEDAVQDAADYALGGYLLFTRDMRDRTPEEVASNIAAYQQAATIPLFIGVDEEGGSVTRISKFPAFRSHPFPSPQALWKAGGLQAVQADTAEKCSLLRSLGINLNLAPVCDVSQNPEDYIYPRTLGLDAEQTACYVQTVVSEMTAQGMGCVLKHFPGYGGSQDTHTAIARDDRPYEAFAQSDFLPFQAGIEAGAGMVLVSHNIVSCMDNQYPASLSPAVHNILRKELGFQGVIVTDDLAMSGAEDFAGAEQAAVLAVLAGNDLLCCTDYQLQIPAVLQAVKDGTISLARIDQSVLRILELKVELGLLPAYPIPAK